MYLFENLEINTFPMRTLTYLFAVCSESSKIEKSTNKTLHASQIMKASISRF